MLPEVGGLLAEAFGVVFGNVDTMLIVLGFTVLITLLMTIKTVYERTRW